MLQQSQPGRHSGSLSSDQDGLAEQQQKQELASGQCGNSINNQNNKEKLTSILAFVHLGTSTTMLQIVF